jgi:outer membrane protein OmpA-like peptidoglycan-associated protein
MAAAAVLAGCSSVGAGDAPVGVKPGGPSKAIETTQPNDAAPTGSGIVAGPASTAFALEARDIRLVRVDEQDLALQFELYNGTRGTVEPYDVGMGKIERDFKLVDLPRATSYDVQQENGFDGRVSGQYEKIAPGSAATITAVFTAPPQESTKLWFMNDVLQPVEVPIEPVGSDSLIDDPVLRGQSGGEPYVNTLMCPNRGAGGEATEGSVEIKLPSDVLFEFGKADLTPAALSALDGVKSQLSSAKGTITVEGHTDAIGDDASNQALSDARAASVRAALQERLGSGFIFETVGFGETRPVAPNANPDGSDNPDGRAENRRVEIRSGEVTAAGPIELQARELSDDLSAKGAVAEVESVKRISGHLVATVTLTNPTSTAIEVPHESGLTNPVARPIGITLADATNLRRAEVCTTGGELLEGFGTLAGPPSGEFEPTGDHLLLPGESVQLWGFYAAPPADITTVDVEIGGLGKVESAPITG